MDVFDKPKVLVLFSGGKDSFITACRTVSDGYKAVLISCQTGSIFGEPYLRYGAERLIDRFGEDCVEYAGMLRSSPAKMRLSEGWLHSQWQSLGGVYPLLSNCQIQCLNCQTAMWICAIAYAKAKNISFLECGYKASDVFCTGIMEYTEIIKSIASKFNKSVRFPVWDMEGDFERDTELMHYGFHPSVLEPKCMLGCPPREQMTEETRGQLMQYCKDILVPKVEESIPYYSKVYTNIRLGTESFELFDKPKFGDDT